MKETTKMSRAVGQLEKMYHALNTDYFSGELETPIITVQSKPGTWGHCSVAKIWRRKEDSTYEMNIAAEVLDKELEEIIDTLLHEMIHLYCRMKGIKETSRNGTYHNGKFKELAERCGLVCVKTAYGWNTVGKGNEKLIEYALSKGWTEFRIGRGLALPALIGTSGSSSTTSTPGSTGRAPSSTRKYICPCCKMSVRATKIVNIMCGDCHETMILA